MITKCLLGMAALFLLTSGCAMVGPDYVKPPAREPKQWIEKEAPQIKSEPTELGEWWKLFNDPVLDKLIATAYNQNLTLRISGIRILQARAQLGIATGTLYPQVQRGARRVHSHQLKRKPRRNFPQKSSSHPAWFSLKLVRVYAPA